MNKIKLYRLFIKFRGILLFALLFAGPLIFIYLFRYALISLSEISGNEILKNISNDKFLIIPLHYIIFILLLFVIYKRARKKTIDFFSKEDWLVSMEKAIKPAIIAFALGFFCTLLIVSLFELIPTPDFVKNWLKTPNYGFVYLLENIEKEDQIKVILLFFHIIVLVPIYEEILFRGFLQDSFGKLFKKNNLDIILVSLVFSSFHLVSLSNAIFAFIIGFFLSKKRKEYNSINTSIWIHSIVNFTGLLSGIIFLYFNKMIQ